MPAYVIADGDVHDPAVDKEYRARAAPTVARHGGRYLVRGGDVTDVQPGRVLPLRLTSAKCKLAIVQGLEAGAPLPP